MSEFKINQEVWVRSYVKAIDHRDPRQPIQVFAPSWPVIDNVSLSPPTTERKPWDVLREALTALLNRTEGLIEGKSDEDDLLIRRVRKALEGGV